MKGEPMVTPNIVCLCGSTKFKDLFAEVNKLETMQGHIVLAPGVFGHADGIILSDETKTMLDDLHFRKIDLADEVVIVSVDGYTGESTKQEIAYAKKVGKPVRWWAEVK
jgi:hypothetical protein